MEHLVCTVVLRDASVHNFVGDIIGVDYGALVCAQHKKPMTLAIGDFDSISKEDLPLIEKSSDKVIQLPAKKDVSDFEAALEHCDQYETIIVLGALGGRFDHQYSLMSHLKRDKRLVFLDEFNKIYTLESGQHIIKKEGYRYLSLFALTKSLVSIDGVKYPLNNQTLDITDTFTLSNEIKDEKAIISIESGHLLIIQSND